MDDGTSISGYIDFEKERAAGNLVNDMAPTTLSMEGLVVGTIDKNNLIHWNGKLTLEMCQKYIQGQIDQTRWMANLPR